MVKYKIIEGKTYDVILWNGRESQWIPVRSFKTRCEALEYVNKMLSAILALRELELREARAKLR